LEALIFSTQPGNTFMNLYWYDFAGFLGVVCILGSYWFLQTGQLAADSAIYQWANILSCALMLVSLAYEPNKSSITIQIAWLFISIYGLLRAHRIKKKSK
jgi:paired small multidrug resistance pump